MIAMFNLTKEYENLQSLIERHSTIPFPAYKFILPLWRDVVALHMSIRKKVQIYFMPNKHLPFCRRIEFLQVYLVF